MNKVEIPRGSRVTPDLISVIVLLRQLGIASTSAQAIRQIKRLGDACAMADDIARRTSNRVVWPRTPDAEEQARALCSELQMGFGQIIAHCPLFPKTPLMREGALIWRGSPVVRADVLRLASLWSRRLNKSGGPMLFNEFTAADAFSAPLCLKLVSYCLPLPGDVVDYVRRIQHVDSVRFWAAQPSPQPQYIGTSNASHFH